MSLPISSTVILVIIATRNVFASPSRPSCTDTVYATISGGELAVSKDAGETWTTSQLPSPLKRGVVSIAANGDALYAVPLLGNLHVSHDKGQTWKRLTIPTSLPDGRQYAGVTYAAGNRVYVGTWGEGGRFAISDDQGETWPINVRLSPGWRPGTFSGYEISAIHASNGRSYVGTWSKGVGISEDDGKTWRFVGEGKVFAIAGVGDKVYVGYGISDGTISISEDGGKSWRIQKMGHKSFVSSIAAVKDKVFVAHGGGGLSVSSDGGKTWVARDMPNGAIFANLVAMSGNNVYLGTDKGVFISRDGGDTWSTTKLEGIQNIFVQCV